MKVPNITSQRGQKLLTYLLLRRNRNIITKYLMLNNISNLVMNNSEGMRVAMKSTKDQIC